MDRKKREKEREMREMMEKIELKEKKEKMKMEVKKEKKKEESEKPLDFFLPGDLLSQEDDSVSLRSDVQATSVPPPDSQWSIENLTQVISEKVLAGEIALPLGLQQFKWLLEGYGCSCTLQEILNVWSMHQAQGRLQLATGVNQAPCIVGVRPTRWGAFDGLGPIL